MKNRSTLFNANHLAVMHGLSINSTPSRVADSEAAWEQEKPRRNTRRSPWSLFLLHLVAKLY